MMHAEIIKDFEAITAGLYTMRSGGVPWVTIAKIGTPDEYLSAFLGSLVEL